MAKKLTFEALQAAVGPALAIAAYVTRHGKVPPKPWRLCDLAYASAQVTAESKETAIILDTLKKTKESFDEWIQVLYIPEARECVVVIAITKCLAEARTFHQKFGLARAPCTKNALATKAAIKAARTPEQILTCILNAQKIGAKNYHKKVLWHKLRRAKGSRYFWSQILLGDRYERVSKNLNLASPSKIFTLATRRLKAGVKNFNQLRQIDVNMFPCNGQTQAFITRAMASRAKKFNDWLRVAESARELRMQPLEKRAVNQLMKLARSFDQFRFITPATRQQAKQKIAALRRLAKTSQEWIRVVYLTKDPADIKRLKAVATLNDWLTMQYHHHFSPALAAARTEALAAHLKEEKSK